MTVLFINCLTASYIYLCMTTVEIGHIFDAAEVISVMQSEVCFEIF